MQATTSAAASSGAPPPGWLGLGRPSRGSLVWLAAAMLLFTAAALLFTWPLAPSAAASVPFKPGGDQLWIMGILEWQRRALVEQPDQFFRGHFYYGAGAALFGSDLLLGLLPLSAAAAWLTGNPALAFNAAYVGSFVLNALAMYAAACTLTGSRPAALLAGVVYAYAPAQLAYVNHPQLAAAWWLPLAVSFGVRFARTLRWTDAAAAAAMVWAQVVTSAQLGLHAALALAVVAGPAALWHVGRRRDWRLALRLLAVGLAAAAAVAPIAAGYLDFADAWRADRDLSEVRGGSAQLTDYLSPSARLRWYDGRTDVFPAVPIGERRIFPGVVVPLLALGGIAAGLAARNGRRNLRSATLALGVLAVGGVVLSLGPNWRWDGRTTEVELPFRALYDLFPPFRAIRVAARFSLLAHAAAALLAGVGLAEITRRLRVQPRLAPLAGLAVAGLVMLEAWPNPIPVYPLPERPELHAALRQARDGPVLLVPLNAAEVERTWVAALARSGPLVNGYSGHIWPQTWHFRDMTQGRAVFEAADLAAALSAFGVRTVIVDDAVLGPGGGPFWAAVRASPHAAAAVSRGGFTSIRLRPPLEPPSRGWADLRADVLAATVPPAAGMISALVLENTADRPWTPPGNSRVRTLELVWTTPDGRAAMHAASDLLPPPFLLRGQVHRQPLHFFTPPTPGDYRLRAHVDGVQLFDRPVRVDAAPAMAFQNSAQGLRARLTLRTPARFETPPGEPLPLHVDALNTGQVPWEEPAVIQLGWRYFRIEADGSERELPELEGRLPLLAHDYTPTAPGAGYAFAGAMPAPTEPGRYVARISMLAELVAWFDIAPIEVQVLVER